MFSWIVDFILNLLLEPAIIIGLLVAVGYALDGKGITKVITGAISAAVGLLMIIFGGGQFTQTFRPIVEVVSEHHQVTGYLMDPYAMRSSTQEGLGQAFGFVGYVFLIAFSVNLLLVFFSKYTKTKGLFLTGNTGVAQAQAILWLVYFWFGLSWPITITVSGILLGLYWAWGTTLAYKPTEKVTNGAGFTIGHNQMFGIWFFSKISHIFGNPEEENAENLQLPGWLSIFNNNVTSIAIVMSVFVGGFLLSIGIDNVQEFTGNTHWLVYILNIGLAFSMNMMILLQGVRMLVGELNSSFKGIQERFVPDAVPAIDVAALLAFGPNAGTLGFIFTTLGTVISILILIMIGSPIIVLPGFVPLFFAGGPIGVVANKYGGYKATIVSGLLLGIIQTFGTVWAIQLSGLPDGVGWTGMFDWATVIPVLQEIMRFISNLFGLGANVI